MEGSDLGGREHAHAGPQARFRKHRHRQARQHGPDGHEHADEAFKMVARAFSVLGDKEKRDKYDRFGTDPDSRFASAQQQNPFSGFAARNAGGGGGGGGGVLSKFSRTHLPRSTTEVRFG